MIYLVILLVLCQVIHFIYYQKIILSAKRRHRATDSQVRHLSEWIVSNHESLSHQLETINVLVYRLYIGQEAPGFTTDVNATEQTPLSVLMQAAHKEALEKVKLEHLQQYYGYLLQELQQAGNQPYKVPDQKNPLMQQLLKKEITGRLNGQSRFE
jgi:hypothetical protein